MLKNKLCVPVHFVWATWDRLPLITEDIRRDLYRYIDTVCTDDKCEVIAIGGIENHIHLLVLLTNTMTLAELMKHVKGGSSRFFTAKLKPGEWFSWQGSYGAYAVSRQDINPLTAYIENQKQHHANGTFRPEAEETGEEC